MVGTASRRSRFLFIATPAQSLLMSKSLLYMHYTLNYIDLYYLSMDTLFKCMYLYCIYIHHMNTNYDNHDEYLE